MSKILYLVRGVPGSGKTTLATNLANAINWDGDYTNDAIVHSADDYFVNAKGEYKFDASQLWAAHKQCLENTKQALNSGMKHVFVANTFTTKKEMKPFNKLAEQFGYMVVSIIVENRHGNDNVHDVPDDKVQAMKDRFDVQL